MVAINSWHNVSCFTDSYLQNYTTQVNAEQDSLVVFTCGSFADANGLMKWTQCVDYIAEVLGHADFSTILCDHGFALTSFNALLGGSDYHLFYTCCTSNALFGQLFLNNSAAEGSVVHLGPSSACDISSKARIVSPVGIIDNDSGLYGGTMFAVTDTTPKDNQAVMEHLMGYMAPNSAHWSNNSGVKWAAQTVLISSQEKIIKVSKYYAVLDPFPVISTFDFFGRLNVSDSASLVSVSILEDKCNGYLATISGSSYPTTTVTKGIALFDQLSVTCFPGGNLTLGFSLTPAGMGIEYTVTTRVVLLFRDCVGGEVMDNAQCRLCSEGTYSLKYEPGVVCASMPSGVDACRGNILSVSQGFWRISDKTTTMMQCPRPKTCLGGNGFNSSLRSGGQLSLNNDSRSSGSSITFTNMTFDQGCKEGSFGPMCSLCSQHYYYSVFDDICMACEGSQGGTQLLLLILIPTLMIAVLFVAVFSFAPRMNALTGLEVDANITSEVDENHQARDMLLSIGEYIKDQLEDILSKVKILVSIMQIITNMPGVLNIK